jgi:hypothetical protein
MDTLASWLLTKRRNLWTWWCGVSWQHVNEAQCAEKVFIPLGAKKTLG